LKDISPKCHELRGNIQSCKPEEKTTSQWLTTWCSPHMKAVIVCCLFLHWLDNLEIVWTFWHCRINTIYVHAPTCTMFWTLCETDQKTSLEARCFSCFYDLYRYLLYLSTIYVYCLYMYSLVPDNVWAVP
jgi:hypothetical protein